MPLSQVEEDAAGVGGFQTAGRLEGRRQDSSLLSHRSFLPLQQVLLVGIEKQNAGGGEKYQEEVECHQADRDA